MCDRFNVYHKRDPRITYNGRSSYFLCFISRFAVASYIRIALILRATFFCALQAFSPHGFVTHILHIGRHITQRDRAAMAAKNKEKDEGANKRTTWRRRLEEDIDVIFICSAEFYWMRNFPFCMPFCMTSVQKEARSRKFIFHQSYYL